ncbi:H(+)/Cl(-) exchange transporter ClcA [Aquisphaera giovannonii]|uniref:H(+)/Cl(-) exchange transporter ClcA n=1 Tax=Aquisphaera giovannonii TaxID=406548 RepID=A0A5B9W3G7_9BACT|nr:chloride channel protein [Aquisphaera giovannonii]QEH34641.1 H(+)/Cl(-) exchange transporter ClcA [Aquisphaera giovannonii]
MEKVVKEGGDFTAEFRLVGISAIAVAIGAVCALVALGLLRMIDVFTNLFYYQSLGFHAHPPAENTLGWWAVLVPVAGGLIIGLMARYGSERIRGHGIPEAMEAILIGKSRMSAKVAVLKPVASAISIGSGGPFGAEGPIIMTGGSIGSLIAQGFHLTAAERKTLLVAGAAGGMSATFNTPMAAVLLAVELLLFEWKPRSLIPVALASAVAALLRPYLLGSGPMFPVAAHGTLPTAALAGAVLVGLLAGLLALLLTVAVYAAEDAFHRLPFHWMWWPSIGGLAVGIGGLIQPRALGVGYDIIEDLLSGRYDTRLLAGLIVVKAVIWAVALGSGTSGGVLAPLLIMGGSLGALEAGFLPGADRALWPLVSMAAALGGTMRSPLTSVIFALELTHDVNTLPALLIASTIAHGFTVLVMKRSILTEKVARRGYHISREYAVDPLERLSVGEVMTADVVAVPASTPVRELMARYFLDGGPGRHPGYPVVGPAGKLLGVITRSNFLDHWTGAYLGGQGDAIGVGPVIAYDLIDRPAVTISPGDSCRVAAERMARSAVKRLPVVSPDDPGRMLGIVSLGDLLRARQRFLDEESTREQFYALGRRVPGTSG